MKRFLRHGLSFLFVAGLTLALWPLGQAVYGRLSQRALMAQWPATKTSVAAKPKSTSPSRVVKPALAGAKGAPTIARAAIQPWPSTRIRIPEIGVDAIAVQGLDDKALARGPGHDPRSALPGQAGNCVLAAHRNVYGAWFSRVNELWAGSIITLSTPDADYNYQVVKVITVSESDGSVRLPPSDPNAAPQLTLITCTVPRTSNRIIVTASAVANETTY